MFFSPINDYLTDFGRVTALEKMNDILREYGKIDDINLEDNSVHMMTSYNPDESLVKLIGHIKKGREFARAIGQTISKAMIVPKGINLLSQTYVLNDDIREK